MYDFQLNSTAVYICSFHHVVIITPCLHAQLNNNMMVKQGKIPEGSNVIDFVLNTSLLANLGIVCLES